MNSIPQKPKPAPIERVADRIRGRNWNQIRGLWTPYLPVAPIVHQFSGYTATQACDASGVIASAPITGELRIPAVANLRESIFRESLFLLTKAIYLVRSLSRQTASGYPSWAFVAAYHSSLFACQTILRLLGVSIVQSKNQWAVVDVWPGAPKGGVQQARRHQRNAEIQFMRCNKVDQRHWWLVFNAVVSDTEIGLWDAALRDAIVDLSETMFARQRNLLIYDVAHWPFDDLAGPTCLTLIPAKYPGVISAADFTASSSYFSIASAITLIRFSLTMLDDIAAHTVAFQPIPAQFRDLIADSDADAITRMSR